MLLTILTGTGTNGKKPDLDETNTIYRQHMEKGKKVIRLVF